MKKKGKKIFQAILNCRYVKLGYKNLILILFKFPFLTIKVVLAIYFEALKSILEKGHQGLVMLPEIGLTTQFEKKFIEFFGFKPAVWHSGITKKNKEIIWSGIVTGEIKVVIGA